MQDVIAWLANRVAAFHCCEFLATSNHRQQCLLAQRICQVHLKKPPPKYHHNITAAPAAGYVVPPRAAHSSTATSSCSVPRRVVRLDVNDSVLARYASAGAAARELSSILSTNAKGQGEMMGWNQTVTDSSSIGPVTLRVVYASTCARCNFKRSQLPTAVPRALPNFQ